MYNYINIFSILLISYILIYIIYKYFMSSRKSQQSSEYRKHYHTKYIDDEEETIFKTKINKNILIENFVDKTEKNIKNIIDKYNLSNMDNNNKTKKNNQDKIKDIENVKPNLSSLKTTTKQNLQCKFLNNCNDEYKSTGANLNLDSESGMLTCGDGSTLKKATAIASTNEEYYIDKIYLTNQGLGYTTNPIVKIKSDVTDSDPIITKSVINNGKLHSILLPENKKKYFHTPLIEIDSPKGINNCKLCCK